MERNFNRTSQNQRNNPRRRIQFRKPDKSRINSHPDPPPPSANETDGSNKKKVEISDFRARYWSYLFENFHRAVDEIYCVCEADESEIECQEMMMMLDVCKKDFEALIRRFKIQRDYAKTEKGRGRYLAWEVRKSPSKHHNTFKSYLAKQQKNKDSDADSTYTATPTNHSPDNPSTSMEATTVKPSSSSGSFGSSCSWADKVRGYSIPQVQNRPESTTGHQNQSPAEHQNQSPAEHQNQSPAEYQNQSPAEHQNQSPAEHQNQSPAEHKTENKSKESDATIPVVTSTVNDNREVEELNLQSNEGSRSRSVSLEDVSLTVKSVGGESVNANDDVISSTDVATSISETTPSATPTNSNLDFNTNDIATVNIDQDEAMPPLHSDATTDLTSDVPLDVTQESCSTEPCSQTAPITEATSTTDSWKDMVRQHDEEKERTGNLLWADRCDSPPLVDEDFVNVRETRSPGRAVQLHQKLSSPLRKKSGEHSIKMLEEKQVKAEMFREKKKEEMLLKSKSLSDKIREFQQSRDSITILKKEAMEEKLERAEKLRESHIQEKIRKAQEEDIKVNEIAFINSLEAQNKKIEVLERHQGVEARLHDIEEERLRKIEENLAKEEAAQERRKALEAERKAKLQERNQKRKEQDAKFQMNKLEKEKAREEVAKERERKIEARQAAMLLSAEELGKKIQMKHDSSSKRYDQHLEYKKERALLGFVSRHSSTDYAPCVKAYQEKRWCSVCNVKIISEVYLMSHLKGKKHRDSLLANGLTEEQTGIIVLAPESVQKQTVSSEVEERMKAGKKRAKKLRQKMSGRTREGESLLQSIGGGGGGTGPTSRHAQRFIKLIKSLNRFIDLSGDTLLAQVPSVEKTLAELNRLLASKNNDDQSLFSLHGGVTSLSRLLLIYSDPSCLPVQGKQSQRITLPEKPLLLALTALELACTNHLMNSHYMILSNKIVPLVDLAHRYFSFPDTPPRPSVKLAPTIPTEHPPSKLYETPPTQSSAHISLDKSLTTICGSLFNVIAVIMSSVVIGKSSLDSIAVKDCISYVVSIGLVDRLAEYFRSITGLIEEMATAHLIISGLNMLLAFMALLHTEVEDVFDPRPSDQTQIISVLRQTEMAGILSLLYALLLHDGPPRHSSVPPILPPYILSITAAGIRTINNSLMVGLKVIQNCLGAEGISLEFRHVLGYLLWYCTHHHHVPLLHELILAVGYFSVLHIENQMFLLAGRSPTLLQLLCGLPFEYFSDPELEDILFPTLISSCYNVPASKDVLKLEINCKLLCVYLKSKIEAEKQARKKDTRDTWDFFSLRLRFPLIYWNTALEFFAKEKTTTSSIKL